jgi:hypothetical protein
MSGATTALRGGRTWWAHFEFTRINIAPIFLRKKIEEQLIVEACLRFSVRCGLWRSQ